MDPPGPLVLELQSLQEAYPAGVVPAFRLTIRNVGAEPEKVLKLRGDLQDTYYDLVVSRDGRQIVDIPHAISDPGPVTDEDFITLKPGEQVVYELTRFAIGQAYLKPGDYTAAVRFWRPGEPFDINRFSSRATFRVE